MALLYFLDIIPNPPVRINLAPPEIGTVSQRQTGMKRKSTLVPAFGSRS